MKVIKWASEEKAQGKKISVGRMGGWFNDRTPGQRWKDYIETWDKNTRPYLEAIRESVVEKGSRLTGHDHQYSRYGIPIFEDDTIASFSLEGWGDLMAAIWSEEDNKDYSYIDFCTPM